MDYQPQSGFSTFQQSTELADNFHFLNDETYILPSFIVEILILDCNYQP
jgi:hypothetical protein